MRRELLCQRPPRLRPQVEASSRCGSLNPWCTHTRALRSARVARHAVLSGGVGAPQQWCTRTPPPGARRVACQLWRLPPARPLGKVLTEVSRPSGALRCCCVCTYTPATALTDEAPACLLCHRQPFKAQRPRTRPSLWVPEKQLCAAEGCSACRRHESRQRWQQACWRQDACSACQSQGCAGCTPAAAQRGCPGGPCHLEAPSVPPSPQCFHSLGPPRAAHPAGRHLRTAALLWWR